MLKVRPVAWHAIFICIIISLVIAAYHTTLSWMYGRFISADSYYSHGFLVPVVSGYLIWKKRAVLSKCQVETSWWGFVVCVFACFIHLVGIILYVFSVSGFSLFFMVFGIVLFLTGWMATSHILFPLIFLVFMFPLPSAVISVISFPLKMLVAHTGVWITRIFGIPVFQEGFYITIPKGSLLIGNPCSGLRSLIAFTALGSILAYLSNMSTAKKLFLFLSTIPIAIISNILRVPILIFISHFWGIEAAAPDTFWHDASGVFVFLIGLMLLFITSKWLE